VAAGTVNKLLYEPFSLAFVVAGGVLPGVVFKQV
jgi:hypothetical protein